MSTEFSGIHFGVYTVQSGDCLSKIVQEQGGDVNVSTFDEIKEQNADIKDINQIYVGQEIFLDSSTLEGQMLSYINGLVDEDNQISSFDNFSDTINDDIDLEEFTSALVELQGIYLESNNANLQDELEVVNKILNQIDSNLIDDKKAEISTSTAEQTQEPEEILKNLYKTVNENSVLKFENYPLEGIIQILNKGKKRHYNYKKRRYNNYSLCF